MTTWEELRTVALVGTERRALPPPAPDSWLADLSCVPGTQDKLSAEHVALQSAALLGIARRSGAATPTGEPPESASDLPSVDEVPPSDQALQLLQLMLSGNAGPSILANNLVAQWFTRCGERQQVLPHDMLVSVLDYVTTHTPLRDLTRPVIGERGRWLAARRDQWRWAQTPSIDHDRPEPSLLADAAQVLEMGKDQRSTACIAARAADQTAGRRLIATVCAQLDAAPRARLLGCFADHLNLDDEELLETALDDRSKAVRTTAIDLLNGLTESARAARLSRQLEPLVTKTGKLRVALNVDYPLPPEGDALRDLAPTTGGVIEQQWFDSLIAGTPLSWWEETLGLSPAKIVNMKSNLPNELAVAWTKAATAQKNTAWLEALFDKTRDPKLVPLLASVSAANVLRSAIQSDSAGNKIVALILHVPGPWSNDFSSEVIKWARTTNEGKGAQTRMSNLKLVMASRLDPSMQSELTTWLETVRDPNTGQLETHLRAVIQHLSLRTSIDSAFQ